LIHGSARYIGKGKQELRDIPQSVTVVTEKLIDDRNLDTLKDALQADRRHHLPGGRGRRGRHPPARLLAAGHRRHLRRRHARPGLLRPRHLQLDRIEVLRGSASMLFGRGSTGGAVNQVSKVPRLIDEHQVDVTLGSHNYRASRATSTQAGENAALRVNAMAPRPTTTARAAASTRRASPASYRWGIGSATSSRSACTTWTTTTA
jgi:catecholate siderophore receptor